MSDDQLVEQFKRCEKWNNADQWDALGIAYYQRGYSLNAGACFKRADAVRATVLEVAEVV